MSRIGNQAISVPSTVKVELRNHTVRASGPKGELSWDFPPEVQVEFDSGAGMLRVSRSGESAHARALHGLSRALIANMIIGVAQGYEKKLEIYGTGYGCKLSGNKLLLNVGFMGRGLDAAGKPREAQFVLEIPKGLEVTVEVPAARGDSDPARLTIRGPDKHLVGQFAADVRGTRPPEPYKGKGIRYAGEYVRRKQGKAFASGGG
jgi:large subunit ribosomal protein L6